MLNKLRPQRRRKGHAQASKSPQRQSHHEVRYLPKQPQVSRITQLYLHVVTQLTHCDVCVDAEVNVNVVPIPEDKVNDFESQPTRSQCARREQRPAQNLASRMAQASRAQPQDRTAELISQMREAILASFATVHQSTSAQISQVVNSMNEFGQQTQRLIETTAQATRATHSTPPSAPSPATTRYEVTQGKTVCSIDYCITTHHCVCREAARFEASQVPGTERWR